MLLSLKTLNYFAKILIKNLIMAIIMIKNGQILFYYFETRLTKKIIKYINMSDIRISNKINNLFLKKAL